MSNILIAVDGGVFSTMQKRAMSNLREQFDRTPHYLLPSLINEAEICQYPKEFIEELKSDLKV